MISLQDLKSQEFWQDKKRYLKLMNNLLISYFKWFVVLVVLVVLAVGGLFLVRPKYQEVNSFLRYSQQRQQDMFKRKNERLEELQEVISSYNSVSSRQKEKVRQMIPNRKNSEEMFTKFNYLVEENNLILKSLSIKDGTKANDRKTTNRKKEGGETVLPASPPKGVASKRVELVVLGADYDSLKNLLKTFEKSLPVMDVVNINFSPEGQTTKLTLRTYQLK